jgi:periplasmic protein TonB
MKKAIIFPSNAFTIPSTQNFDDVTFEHRNKNYGAYSLRQSYDESLKKASLVTLLFLVMSCSLVFVNQLFAKEKGGDIDVQISFTDNLNIEAHVETPKPEKPKPVTEKPQVRTTAFVVPEPKPNPPVETPPPTVDALQNATNVGATTQNGTDTPSLAPPPAAPSIGTGTAAPTPVEKPEEILDFAQELPEFEGGQTEMMRFLYKNIHYPSIARENNIQGRVVLRFVVDEAGKISDIVVLKDIGGGCAEEATRILKTMPRWKAGKQGGRFVKVRMTLPVLFRLE